MKFRDLEKARRIIKNATKLDISYAYDDLVFPEHAAFLLKFDDNNDKNFFCYFHKDCRTNEQKKILANLIYASGNEDCTMVVEGIFNMKQKGEEIEIHFL